MAQAMYREPQFTRHSTAPGKNGPKEHARWQGQRAHVLSLKLRARPSSTEEAGGCMGNGARAVTDGLRVDGLG